MDVVLKEIGTNLENWTNFKDTKNEKSDELKKLNWKKDIIENPKNEKNPKIENSKNWQYIIKKKIENSKNWQKMKIRQLNKNWKFQKLTKLKIR